MKCQIWDFHFSFFFSFSPIIFFYVHLCCFYWVKTMLSWLSCLTPLTLLPHHSIFFFFFSFFSSGIMVKKRNGKRGFTVILKVMISHESHNFRYSMCDSKFNSCFSLLLSLSFLCVLCFICVHVIYLFICFCSVFVCVCVI